MARDTAFVMSTEGVRFPGTEIRDVMRAADLTHISTEVSFYEGCPFPNPDYTGYIFCSEPAYIDLLADLGADIIELTGNHNNDTRALYKVDSVPFTLDLYREYGMQWYAGGVNIDDAKAPCSLKIMEINWLSSDAIPTALMLLGLRRIAAGLRLAKISAGYQKRLPACATRDTCRS